MTINPDEFEPGTNVTARVRGEKSHGLVISVRLNQEDADALLELAESSGRTLSDLGRMAVRTMLGREKPTAYTLEISYGAPPSHTQATANVDMRSSRETFAPPVLQVAAAT